MANRQFQHPSQLQYLKFWQNIALPVTTFNQADKIRIMRVSDYIFERLVEVGLTHTYSVTGRGALFLTDAVAKNENLKNISTHHEQAAGYAAVAHSQYTNKISVCLVSTGCASTNAVTAVLSAWQDGIPTFFISGQNTLAETTRYTGIPIRTFGQQEADIITLIQPITKYAVMLTDPQNIGIEMDKLIEFAMTGRKGPVWLDVPLDIQSMQIDPDGLVRWAQSKDEEAMWTNSKLETFESLLNQSKSPLFLLGHGVRSADSIPELEALLKKTQIPLIFTASAVDIFGSANVGSVGSIGMMGCARSAAQALQEADLLIVLGSRMNSMVTGPDFNDFGRNAKVVVVDIDPVEHSKPGRKIDLFLEIDILHFLQKIFSKTTYKTSESWIDHCEFLRSKSSELEKFMLPSDGVDLYQLANAISELLPDNGVLVTDSGLIELILPTNVRFKLGQRCLHPVSQGAMGYALPAAVGAHYASGEVIYSVIGDGSIMMNIQELQTIRHNKIPIVIIVVNNDAYSIIRKRQSELFRGRTIGTDSSNGVSCPNFEEVARCFELKYMSATNLGDFRTILEQCENTLEPILIELQGIRDQEYIQIARKKDSSGKLQRMPIEVQFPFVDTDMQPWFNEKIK
jgi:acetolactate synthase-1/2/3 large subunit